MRLNDNFRVFGVNAGLGVALYPFKKYLIGAIETRKVFHTPGQEQWQANFKGIPLYRDYIDIPANLDLVISSPDCGSGSMLRYSRAKQLGDHTFNQSLLEFLRAITTSFPKFFLFENLAGLFKSFPESDFRAILKDYRLVMHNKSVSYFGNSQLTRKRLVIIGIRRDLPQKLTRYFKCPDYRSEIKACWDIYGDLTDEDYSIGHIRENPKEVISIHAKRRMSFEEIAQEWQTRLKGKKRWLSPGYTFSTAPGVYRNLNKDYPATARKANRQFDESGLALTPRQLARIMGIPDKFDIYTDKGKHNYWINKGRNTVTKGMVFEVPVWVKRCLIKNKHLWQT